MYNAMPLLDESELAKLIKPLISGVLPADVPAHQLESA